MASMSLQSISRQSSKIAKSIVSNGKQLTQCHNSFNINKIQQRNYRFDGVYLHPGPGDVDIHDGAEKPEGVPDTWTTIDIANVDFGRFDENTFPPALEGETLEQYCRRVPNIWSPCSNANDVVDVIMHMELVYAVDPGPTKMSYFLEEALVKIPPESADWHVTYVPDYEAMLKEMMFRTRPFPVRVTDAEFDKMLVEFEKGVKNKGIDHHFRARSFHEFWQELTDKPLKDIANVNTWEEEIDRRMQLAIARNAQKKLEDKEAASVEAH